jgi:hypothetical protein
MSIQEQVPLWQEVHVRLYSTPGDKWWETYAIWTRLFEAEGWTDEQVVNAVYRTARRDVLPRFAPEHLQAIREELRMMFKEQSDLRRKQADEVGCDACSGTGWICDLPHPEHVVEGRWMQNLGMYYTVAVCCFCMKGQGIKAFVTAHWAKQPVREGESPMCWDSYTKRNPEYKAQIDVRESLRQAERESNRNKAASSNDETKKRLHEIMAKIGGMRK